MARAPSIVVVGGGTMGLATAWALARRGVAATVVERHAVPHEHGSHSGFTRVIRQAYHEGDHYVPQVKEAQAEYEALQNRVGEPLLVRTGLLELGPRDDAEFLASIEACRRHGVEHEIVEADEARRRWPFEVPEDWQASLTPSGGTLRVVSCLAAFAHEARAAGAVVREHQGVREIELAGSRPAVVLESGDRLEADRVVVTAGIGLPELLPELLRAPLVRLRRVLGWTQPDADRIETLRNMPVWAAFHPRGFFYGFPFGDEGITGLKLALHAARDLDVPEFDAPVDPRTADRAAHAEDLEPLERFLDELMPAGRGPWAAQRVCFYTCTPSWDFIVDRHPDDARVVIAGGFSGHGFKFAPTIGRLVAELVLDDRAVPLHPFSVARHRAQALVRNR